MRGGRTGAGPPLARNATACATPLPTPTPTQRTHRSSYADSPEEAAKSLAPLLELALTTVPKALQPQTRVMVGATAGLRLLPDGKADVILDSVRSWLQGFPFQVGGAGWQGTLAQNGVHRCLTGTPTRMWMMLARSRSLTPTRT